MDRFLDGALDAWVEDDRRLPLLIRGPRQVGKTWTVMALARRRFEDVATVNFEQRPAFRECFETFEPQAILDQISILLGAPVEPGRTLLFLDEIQDCPPAIVALRYFRELFPQLHVIAAGSLLEFALDDERLRMPVGRIQSLYLHPLSFAEFLRAVGEDAALAASRRLEPALPAAVHEHLLGRLRTYLLLGGMPAVVDEYRASGSAARAMRIQADLVQTMRDDFRKYSRRSELRHLDRVFLGAARMAGRKFVYAHADAEARSRDLRQAVDLLERAGIVHRVRATSGAGLPLAAEADDRFFKLVLFDVGLMQNALGASQELLRGDPMRVNDGAVAEQFAGQELVAARPPHHRPELHFWARRERRSNAEVDYLAAAGGRVVPVEVKSGKSGRLRSLHAFIERYRPPAAVRLYGGPFRREDRFLSVPLYAIERLPAFLERELAGGDGGFPPGVAPGAGALRPLLSPRRNPLRLPGASAPGVRKDPPATPSESTSTSIRRPISTRQRHPSRLRPWSAARRCPKPGHSSPLPFRPDLLADRGGVGCEPPVREPPRSEAP